MQDINLLQNKLKDRTLTSDRRNMLIMIVLSLVLIFILGAGGYFYLQNQSTNSKTTSLKTENAAIKSKLDSSQGDLAAAKNFQAQLANIDKLVSNHIYWSEVFDELEDSVIKRSQYLNVQGRTDGNVHIEGVTDSYQNLSKLILSLSTDNNFRDVRLLSIQQSDTQTAGYVFSINLKINEELFIKE